VSGIARALRRLPADGLFNGTVRREVRRERSGGHPVAPGHRAHIEAAIDWMARAQDSTGSGGIARGYSLVWNPYFRLRGWEPAYPEATGYAIPTLLAAGKALGRPGIAERGVIAARWESELQLSTGAVRGGVMGEAASPAIFNTGQVLFGWLAAQLETGDALFEECATRAAVYLVSRLDDDGLWRRDNSRFALAGATLYNVRVAWALAETGARLGMPSATDAAARALRAVARRQRDNGWFPQCCLNDPERPLLHTIAYTVRGLLEGGRVIGDATLIRRAAGAAAAIASLVRPDGTLPGRLDAEWRSAADWSCLTGEAQMVNNWLRLHEVTGEHHWLEPVRPVLQFLKSTQNRATIDPGLRGAIKGSHPMDGAYGRYETLSWATKFFIDALLRHDRVMAGEGTPPDDVFSLA
jgi:hypothetical protein